MPIPPALVAVLREHLAEHGTAPDGRLFFGVGKGENVPGSVYIRIWEQAREIGLSPEQAASPLACRPYDLRHAALSSWLATGVPPTEVAERAGNSVKVLLTVYAKCLDGQRAAYNDRIATLLGERGRGRGRPRPPAGVNVPLWTPGPRYVPYQSRG